MVTQSASRLNSIFHALSDPTRRSILRDVAGKSKSVNEVAKPYAMSLAAVSKHLNVLEAANLIRRRKHGNFHFVELNAVPIKEAERWIAYYEKFWNQKLDDLQTMLEGEGNE